MRDAPKTLPSRLLVDLEFTAATWLLLWSTGMIKGALAQQPSMSPPAAVSTAANNVTTVTTVRQECISYKADAGEAMRSRDGSAVMSAVLVGDEVGPVVGAVDVRDLTLDHTRLGALMVTLSWLPYADELEGINPRELEEIANATSILKDIRQGGSGANITSASFSDASNATIPVGPIDNLNGTFRPATPLSVFSETRLPSRGRWVLVVEDVGSGHKNRSSTLGGWRLVVCPPLNETLPLGLREQMAQQAVGALDLSASRAGQAFSAAVRSAAARGGAGGMGPFGARAASQPLAAAIGTLVTREATIEYKTYSQLADQAVEAAIRFEDNIQSLFGLPYEPPPLIDVWLPWVEVFIGGTDFTIQNAVWPGKIVYYALQLEVFVRTREMMAARGGGGGGSGGMGGARIDGGGNGAEGGALMPRDGDNPDATPNCGVVEGPDGPVMVNKKLLQRELCGLWMPLEFAQYSEAAAPTSSATTRSSYGDVSPASEDDGSGNSSSKALDQDLGVLASSGALRFPTPLAPLDFTIAPQFPRAGDGVRAPLELQRALLDGVGRPSLLQSVRERQQGQDDEAEAVETEESDGSSESTDQETDVGNVRPDPDAINRIIERAFNNLEMEDFNNAMINELEAAIIRGERVSGILDASAGSSELMSRGGDRAVTTAQALKASADTYTEVLRAGQDSLKRFSQQQLRNWTREWLKNGGIKQELDGMNKEGKKRKGQVNRFVWVFNRIRLTFRFSAQDGFQLSFIQWLYNWGDVNNIIGLANSLQAMDRAEKGNRTNNADNKRLRSDGSSSGQAVGEPWNPKAEEDPTATVRASSNTDDAVAGNAPRRRGLMPTGETPAEWFRRNRDEANQIAKRALSRIPIDHTLGINRRVFARPGATSTAG